MVPDDIKGLIHGLSCQHGGGRNELPGCAILLRMKELAKLNDFFPS